MVNFFTYLEIYLDNLRKEVKLSEFERFFSDAHQKIKPRLAKLVKRNILIINKKERFLYYHLNLTNPITIEYILMCEKNRTIELLQKQPLLNRLYEHIRPFNINLLIFGSAATDNKFNDIDLLILGKEYPKKIIKNFEQTYNIKVHTVNTNKSAITKTFLEELRKKHIILSNHDLFVRLLYENEFKMV